MPRSSDQKEAPQKRGVNEDEGRPEDSAAVVSDARSPRLQFAACKDGGVRLDSQPYRSPLHQNPGLCVRLNSCGTLKPEHKPPPCKDMLVGVSSLAISLSFLLYYHPPASWNVWPFAVHALRQPASDRPSSESQMDEAKQNGPGSTAVARGLDLHTQDGTGSKDTPPSQEGGSLSQQTTPKANPVLDANPGGPAIPSFSLEDQSSSDEDEDKGPPPSFPAVNSAQRASAQNASMAPPPAPNRNAQRSSQLMPPPPRIVPSNLRALPTPSRSMHVPSNGPLPNRGPARGSSGGGLGLPPTAPIKTPNARGKVLLSPGHSPLDWANLQKSNSNLSGVQSLVRVTPSLLKHNNGRKGRPAWSSYQGKVYNITPYLPFHPGGEGELRRAAGKDGGRLFMEVHPWVNWENMLGECIVGIMVGEADEQTSQGSSLDDMD